MKTPVAITWSVLLVGCYAVVVPTVVTLLQQSLQAARHIEQYTVEIREHAAGIERNVAAAAALKQTRIVAPALLSTAESLQLHTAAIGTALGAASDGQTPGQEVGS